MYIFFKKYYVIYLIKKKGKYMNYKDLPLKCTFYNNFLLIFIY